jgi:hypothetical protein
VDRSAPFVTGATPRRSTSSLDPYMRRVFVRGSRKFHELAQAVHVAALVDYKLTLRDGLNLGGGERGPSSVLLVRNDEVHADVFVPNHAKCQYSMYVSGGEGAILDQVCQRLNAAGVAAYVADEFEDVGRI